jgi:hypothetical protein
VNDRKLDEFGLYVAKEKKKGRRHGWSKLHSNLEGRHGAINFEWNAATRMLICRVVTRGGGKPHSIIGDLVDYLMSRCRKRIQLITVFAK